MTHNDPHHDPLQKEIDEALSDVNLQDLDVEHRNAAQRQGGERLYRGAVAGISGGDVIVELGPRMQGVISLQEFDAPPEVGKVFDFTLHGQEDGLWKLSRRQARLVAAWSELAPGAWVKALVEGHNSGGLSMRVGPLAAFMPASHVDTARVEDLQSRVGQTLVCEVIELDRERKRILLSRRNVLAKEQQERREELMGALSVGDVRSGVVTRVEAFGAFVDIGGVEGLVHVSNLSRSRVENPLEFVSPGQRVDVKVLAIQEGGKRIGLGMKQLEPDPWDEVPGRLLPDSVVRGKVARLMDFGAFVELLPGVEGMLHVSQMAKVRVRKPQDALAVGAEIEVRILSVDAPSRRIALSRLDARGSVLGSDDAVADEEIEQVLRETQDGSAKTNLGNLFRRALGDQ